MRSPRASPVPAMLARYARPLYSIYSKVGREFPLPLAAPAQGTAARHEPSIRLPYGAHGAEATPAERWPEGFGQPVSRKGWNKGGPKHETRFDDSRSDQGRLGQGRFSNRQYRGCVGRAGARSFAGRGASHRPVGPPSGHPSVRGRFRSAGEHTRDPGVAFSRGGTGVPSVQLGRECASGLLDLLARRFVIRSMLGDQAAGTVLYTLTRR